MLKHWTNPQIYICYILSSWYSCSINDVCLSVLSVIEHQTLLTLLSSSDIFLLSSSWLVSDNFSLDSWPIWFSASSSWRRRSPFSAANFFFVASKSLRVRFDSSSLAFTSAICCWICLAVFSAAAYNICICGYIFVNIRQKHGQWNDIIEKVMKE